MSKKKKTVFIAVWLAAIVILTVCAIISPGAAGEESIKDLMKDAVLHGLNKISFLGLEVNPAVVSAFLLTAILLVVAALIRIFAIPRFKTVPSKFQSVIESAVGFFDGLAKSNSPQRNKFLGAYLFGAGTYIFVGTIFELFGIEVMTTEGLPMSLPAPLSDINAAITMGFLSYGVILGGGLVGNGLKGLGGALKDFSLPISMSFRLFGALLSGALVTELVYYYVTLSFVLPVAVGVLFTLLHAIIQTYVLTMLTSIFYGEAAERHPKKEKAKKQAKA